MKKLACTVLAMAILSVGAAAQNQPAPKAAEKIDGNWSMSVTGPDGNAMSIAVVFKTEGKKVTGTLTGPQGETALEGEYADKKLKFGISVNMNGQNMDIGFTGDMKDDGTLAGVATGAFGELPWSASRSK